MERLTGNAAAHLTDRPSRALPLSSLQKSILLHDLGAGRSSQDLFQILLKLRGNIPQATWQHAWHTILQRHAQLRVMFDWEDREEPVQTPTPAFPLSIQEEDWTSLPPAQVNPELSRILRQDRLAHLDLDQGRLMRVRVFRLPGGSWMLWTVHQIAVDPRSIALVLRNLLLVLQRRDLASEGAGSGEFVEFLTAEKSTDPEPSRRFWREYLQGVRAPMSLSARLPGSEDSAAGLAQTASLELTVSVSSRLRELAASYGSSLRTLMEGTWAILLHRLSGEDEVLFGVTRSRRGKAFAEAVGQFLNTVPRRFNVCPKTALRTWLNQIELSDRTAAEHSHLGLGDLPEIMPDHPERLRLQSLVHFEECSIKTYLAEQGVGSDLIDVELLDQNSVPVVTSITAEQAIRLAVASDTGQVLGLACSRLLELWRSMLESAEATPEAQIKDLSWLTAIEREKVLVEFNRTDVPLARDRCVHHLFEEQAARTPDLPAVVFGTRMLSYRELDTQAENWARCLRQSGLTTGSCVALFCERSVEALVGMLAILKAGAAYVPLDPNYPTERLAFMLEESQAPVVLTQARLLDRLPQTQALKLCLDSAPPDSGAGRSSHRVETAPDGLAYVLFTSGSTGRPKGVAMVHSALVNLLGWQQRSLPLAAGQRVLQFASLSFDVSFQEIFTTWSAGGAVVVISEEQRRDPIALWRTIAEHRIGRVFLPFVALQQAADAAEELSEVPLSLKEVITAGEQLQITPQIRALFQRLPGTSLHNHYGPTETHVVTALSLTGNPLHWPLLPPIGKPIFNTCVYLLDAQAQPVPAGVAGEIYLGGACLARGYLHRPELTNERFLPNPFMAQPSCRIYRTGDLGRHLPDGTIEFLGRADDQVKIRGFRVELGEIESALRQQDGVSDCAVVVRVLQGEKRLIAYLVPKPETSFSVEACRSELKRRLPEYMIPASFVPVPRLPLTPSGKVDRRSLPEPSGPMPAAQRSRISPRSDAERSIAAAWQTVLGLADMGVTDNFFEMGGTSLRVVELQRELKKRLGRPVPIPSLFQYPTIEGLARHLAADEGQESSMLERVGARALAQREALLRRRSSIKTPK